jgi:hypothetical protein
MNNLEQDFEFYLAHQSDMVAKYDGKVVVIKGGNVLGVYGSEFEAYTATIIDHDPGTFIVQMVSEGDSAYTATFQSRVASPS